MISLDTKLSMPSGKRLQYIPPISKENNRINTLEIKHIPYSKSYMIRLFAMASLCGASDLIESWRDESRSCKDIDHMREALLALSETDSHDIYVGSAGAVWRFVTAIAALTTERPIHFRGSERLFERPIQPLVQSLHTLGARIDFTSNEASAMQILPSITPLCGGEIGAETGENSSQFLSALMLIAPYLSSPLTLHIHPQQRSKPYFELTYLLMQKAGAKIEVDKDLITIFPSSYQRDKVEKLFEHPETDWTAVSYPMSWCAIPEAPQSIFIPDCYRESLQGDIVLAKVMESFGVRTRFFPKGILVERVGSTKLDRKYDQDLSGNIDLVPTLFTLCLALNRPFHFRRIGALRYKESDRIEALLSIASSLGYRVELTSDEDLVWEGDSLSDIKTLPLIDPREDHRIAMALTLFAFRRQDIRLLSPEVVEKSYTHFWKDAAEAGITLVD